jgi:ribosomal protein S18 acetylase RimI-like enzyme
MRIRKARAKDISQCVALSNITEFKMPSGEVPDAKGFRQSLGNLFLVAEIDSKVVGLILGYSLTKDVVYLDLLTVHADFRGEKIGQHLIKAFRDQLKKLKYKEYFLIAPTFNKKTLEFYMKNGLKKGKEYTLFSDKV